MSANPSTQQQADDVSVGPGAVKDIQDQEIWMSDGNIIIAALDEAKNERHLFKCYRGLLAHRLPVLKEMFDADPSGAIIASASEHHAGIPLVRLYDEPKHVRRLLQVLYNPSELPYKWWRRETMNDLVGLMRLSKKYDAEDLYKHCTTVFENAWPRSLKEWDQRNKDMTRIWKEEEYRGRDNQVWSNQMIRFALPDPGAAVALADEHDLHASCATAFYALNQIYRTPYYITTDDRGMVNAFPKDHPADISCLSADLLRRFINGRELIRQVGFDICYRQLPEVVAGVGPIHTEEDEPNCKDAVASWWALRFAEATKGGAVYSTDPLGLLDDMSQFLDEAVPINQDICERCRVHIRNCLQESREFLWGTCAIHFEVGNAAHIDEHVKELLTDLREHLHGRNML
ncbi:hypothetical protein BDY19DRAFT_995812 [Irpex rosettiformis]|uniref:Uncharacterized protein n=1 Tax=Irpex rosettiformis TaxID=378272 RepID=A0ACB8TX15_9APHY|nr:hypothetical protein BDY19DRAFT_995812 [Irpex rosettiformis]